MVKAQWNEETIKIFCQLCVGQIVAGNRDRKKKTLSKTGWGNVIVQFGERMNMVYEQKQLRNKWDALKADWLLWKSLMSETGLGFNHETGTVDADDDWWKTKIATNKGYEKLRKSPLKNLTELEMMFSTTVATGETAFTPAACDLFPKNSMVHDEGSADSDDVEVILTQTQSTRSNDKRKSYATNSSTQGAAKKSVKGKSHAGTAKSIGRNINDLCDVVRTFASTFTESSQNNYDPIGSELDECLKILTDLPGVEVGDELYMFGTHLFMKEVARQMFRRLPGEVRVTWLKQRFESSQTRGRNH